MPGPCVQPARHLALHWPGGSLTPYSNRRQTEDHGQAPDPLLRNAPARRPGAGVGRRHGPAEATDAQARCLSADGDFASQVKACTEALASPATDEVRVGLLMRRAGANFRSGQGDAAIADATQAIALAPDNATAYRARGMMRNARFEYELALADLDKALELAPGDAGALRHRAHAHEELGQDELALADFNALLAKDPGYASEFKPACLSVDDATKQLTLVNWPACDE